MKKIIIPLLVVSIIFAGCTSKNDLAPKACTEEAKICPDGSAVGRAGPRCEFSPCPVVEVSAVPSQAQVSPPSSAPKACTMEAKLCPDGSAVGRSGPNCEFAPCPGTATASCSCPQ